ncbi:hypothetical protein ABQF35_04890 [Mycobacterium syngnathidarum]
MIALRSQKVMLWWSLAMAVIFVVGLVFFVRMMPPISATWSSAAIVGFYQEHSASIRFGAVLGAWSSAFLLPMIVVIAAQIYRHEKGDHAPVWTWLTLIGGGLMTVPIALPMVFFGVAAYTPGRVADVTAAMHELAVLTLVTGDQWYIFAWAAIGVISLLPNTVVHSPFPRWYGYFVLMSTLMLEAGAIPFLTRSGIVAWDGFLPWWNPFILFGVWMVVTYVLLFKAINAQMAVEKLAVLAASPAHV